MELQSRAHIHEVPNSKVSPASELQKHPVPKGVCNTSKLKKFSYAQNTSNATSGISSSKEEKGSKMNIMLDMASTGLKISTILANKMKQKYSLFSKFLLSLFGACEIAKKIMY